MRHNDERTVARTPPALEMVSQPRDRLDVQVVRWFIQNQHIPLAHKQARKIDASALST